MADFRAESHAEVRTRRIRISATISVAVTIDEEPARHPSSRRKLPTSYHVPLAVRETQACWDLLPGRIPPEQWMVGQADVAVPGALLAAEAERGPDGFCGPGG